MDTVDSVDSVDSTDWLDDLDRPDLLAVLAEHGTDVNTLRASAASAVVAAGTTPEAPAAHQLIPLQENWLRLEMDAAGRLVGTLLPAPGEAPGARRRVIIFDETDATDLDGWIRARADIDGWGRRWVSVLRRPGREVYAAVVYDVDGDRPVRRMLVPNIYPDVTLCAEDSSLMAFVEPDRSEIGRTRAVLAPVRSEYADGRQVVADSPSGGLSWRASSVRRFVKLSHGVRTLRVWDLVDVAPPRPLTIRVPGVADDPDLFDVALVEGEEVLVQAGNASTRRPTGDHSGDHAGDRPDDHWELTVSRLEDEDVLETWRAATGPGRVLELVSGEECALLRVRESGRESVLRVPLAGFSTGAATLRQSAGLFSLSTNTVTPSVGFAAVEMNGGNPPFQWFFTPEGGVLNTPAEVAALARNQVHRASVRVPVADGFEVEVDLRWRGGSVDADGQAAFRGPVLLMVYGAYGIDIDLDSDDQLGRWLDRGFAVGTPRVRGGAGPLHLAGCRANRERSLADVAAVARWLKRGEGVVQAERLCVLGASAGGFLAATTLNTCPEVIDACVIVNGFVDPLSSLRQRDTSTTASDQDEWGDPENPRDLAVLQAVSPLEHLTDAGPAKALVIVSGNDVRVNPRQGLRWYLRYRELGGQASLWFDPNGAHDCWGAEMDPEALVDWVSAALT